MAPIGACTGEPVGGAEVCGGRIVTGVVAWGGVAKGAVLSHYPFHVVPFGVPARLGYPVEVTASQHVGVAGVGGGWAGGLSMDDHRIPKPSSLCLSRL